METFTHSLWSAITAAPVPIAPLVGDRSADVVIVGGGFLGLSTALHLAEAGTQTVVLEAHEAGFGASGRNTGFVVPSFRTSLGASEVAAAVGRDRGERLSQLVETSGEYLFALVARHGIACNAEPVGWLQPAHTPAYAELLARRANEMTARGRPVSMLSTEETNRRTGIKGYYAALFDASGGQINPLAYARGLAAAAIAAGAAVHAQSRVTEIKADGRGWKLRTSSGAALKAARVLLATNALVGSLLPGYGGGFVPVRIHQIATQPLDAKVREGILLGRTPLSDTRRHTFAVRLSPDNRLMTGGLVIAGASTLARAARQFASRISHFFPAIPELTAEYVWDGVIASTRDGLPSVTTIAPGLDAAIGCNGRGVALTTILGRELAGWLTGEAGERDFVLPSRAMRDIAFRRLASLGPSLWLPWSSFRDWLDTGGPGRERSRWRRQPDR